MPLSALPPGFDNKQKGDWNFWPFKYIKPSLTAFGPRATERWAKWREFPIIIFAFFGRGESRWEESEGAFQIRSTNSKVIWFNPAKAVPLYLSAIQYWCDWSVQLQWPFFFAFHWYTANKKARYFRIGARRNADKFYDFPSAHIGDWN